MSVVKNGFPVPAAKMTTLPFSKCLTALLRIYGSATSDMRNAVCTLVGIPILSIVAWRNIAFMTVASILHDKSNTITKKQDTIYTVLNIFRQQRIFGQIWIPQSKKFSIFYTWTKVYGTFVFTTIKPHTHPTFCLLWQTFS